MEKDRETWESPDQLGNFLGQAAECVCMLISSLMVIKHLLVTYTVSGNNHSSPPLLTYQLYFYLKAQYKSSLF